MTIKEKIQEYLDFKGININEFERSIGASKSYWRNTKNISAEILTDIIRIYSDISLDWLMKNSGDMLKKPQREITRAEEETRPRIPYTAAAGSISIAMEGVTIEQCEQIPVVKAFPKYDFTIQVKGDSMIPEYYSGDEVACLFINNSNFIQWGRVHVLDTAQGIVIKRIYDAGDCILCKSEYSEKYPDFTVPKNEIYSVSLVVGLLRL